MNPLEKPVGSHFALSQIDTLRCQQKELEQRRIKVVACYVATTVSKKAISG